MTDRQAHQTSCTRHPFEGAFLLSQFTLYVEVDLKDFHATNEREAGKVLLLASATLPICNLTETH